LVREGAVANAMEVERRLDRVLAWSDRFGDVSALLRPRGDPDPIPIPAPVPATALVSARAASSAAIARRPSILPARNLSNSQSVRMRLWCAWATPRSASLCPKRKVYVFETKSSEG